MNQQTVPTRKPVQIISCLREENRIERRRVIALARSNKDTTAKGVPHAIPPPHAADLAGCRATCVGSHLVDSPAHRAAKKRERSPIARGADLRRINIGHTVAAFAVG